MLREMPRDAPATRHAVDTIYRNLLIQSRLVSDIVDVSRITKGRADAGDGAGGPGGDHQLGDGHGARLGEGEDASRSRRHSTATPSSSSAMRSGWSRCSGICCRTASGSGARAAWFASRRRSRKTSSASPSRTMGPGSIRRFCRTCSSRSGRRTRHRGGRTTGSGLGLSIARHLVELHGGTMAAANRPRGGAVLTVVLPAKSTVAATER